MFKRFKNWIISLIIGTAVLAGGYGYFGGDKIPAEHKLKCDKADIIFNRKVGNNVSYLYNSKKEVPKAKYKGFDEDITKRTKNAQFFKKNNTEAIARFYVGEPFYKKENKWYQTETAMTTEEEFKKQTKISLLDKILGRNAFAETVDTYVGSGDGQIQSAVGAWPATWDLAHDSTSGASSDNSTGGGPNVCECQAAVEYEIQRTFFPIDTSALDDSKEISAAVFYTYLTGRQSNDNDGDDYVQLVQTTQGSNTSLVNDDFNNCGAVDNPTVGSDQIDISDITVPPNHYLKFTLNSTGRGWISRTGWTKLGMREGHDILDHSIADNVSNYISIDFSEQTGTSQDPYLEVLYLTDIEEQVSGDTDDCYTYNTNARDDRAFICMNLASGATVYGGFRFQSINIPQGATIYSAFLQGKAMDATYDDISTTLYGEDVDSSTVLEGGTLLDNRTRTTANVAWAENGLSTSAFNSSPDIKIIIQEIVNRVGWSANNHITIIAKDTQSAVNCRFVDYSSSSANATKLIISYVTAEEEADRRIIIVD